MAIFPSAQLPSAPPGSSYYTSNALIIAKRVALRLEAPVRVRFGDKSGEYDSLKSWHERHKHARIECMQLCKEQKALFFHEYVAFRLSNGRYFRIDRRQLPDEQSPMACTEGGVEAYDTIEQIADLEDSMYNPSDCLIQLDFERIRLYDLYPFLRICNGVANHGKARVYTVQRYNCYFYAQTVILCMLCYACEGSWNLRGLWGTDGDEGATKMQTASDTFTKFDGSIRILDRRQQVERSPSINSNSELRPSSERNTTWEAPLPLVRAKFKDVLPSATQKSTMKRSTTEDLHTYLSDMICAHSTRVAQYKLLLKCSARDVERDIKVAMDEIWLASFEARYKPFYEDSVEHDLPRESRVAFKLPKTSGPGRKTWFGIGIPKRRFPTFSLFR